MAGLVEFQGIGEIVRSKDEDGIERMAFWFSSETVWSRTALWISRAWICCSGWREWEDEKEGEVAVGIGLWRRWYLPVKVCCVGGVSLFLGDMDKDEVAVEVDAVVEEAATDRHTDVRFWHCCCCSWRPSSTLPFGTKS